MTPDELKQIALNATKKEYEKIMADLKKAANEGSFSCEFDEISDGAMEQLENAGFIIKMDRRPLRGGVGKGAKYFKVSIE